MSPQLLLQLGEDGIRRAAFAAIGRGQPFLHRLDGFQPLGQVEEPLIGFGVLHHQLGLAVDGEHERLAGLLELIEEFGGVPLEVGEGVDIAGQVHDASGDRIVNASNSMLLHYGGDGKHGNSMHATTIIELGGNNPLYSSPDAK